MFLLFNRELVNGKVERRHHAARDVSGSGLGSSVDGSHRLAVGGRSSLSAENFPVQSLLTDCSTTTSGYRSLRGDQNQSMGSLVLAIHFGWSRGAYTNRSAGCSIDIGRRLAKKELVREIRATPYRIAGRGGAVRIRTGGMELALVRFYSLPTSGNREKMRTQKAASVEVMEWPYRVLPVVGDDANTWIGRTSDGTEAMAEVVGPFHRGKQTSGRYLLLAWRLWSSWLLPLSAKEGGPTYCGTQGSTAASITS